MQTFAALAPTFRRPLSGWSHWARVLLPVALAFFLLSQRAVGGPASAGVAGTVRDIHGAAVAGALVTLTGGKQATDRTVTADGQGRFAFVEVAPGTYRVKIGRAADEASASVEVELVAGEKRELPIVLMGTPTTTTTVNVTATLNEVAEAQVKQQEQQRVLGFVPNYYSSYVWDAAPMTPKLKFKLALRSTLDPVSFLVAAGVAGAEQAHKTYPGYGQEFEGYAKRYGSAYADTVVARMMSSAILPTLLHQDPRYFYRGTGSTRSRIFYALVSTFVCRGDNGEMQPNYSQVLGGFAAAGLSNVYRASSDRKASLTFRNGLVITGSAAVTNVLRELFSRKLTSSVPTSANGKP